MSDRRNVVPIGHYAGQQPGERHQIRLGWSARSLDDDEFSLWLLAHGIPRSGRAEWTVDHLVRLAAETGHDDAARTVRTLSDQGLLARVPVASQDAAEFARRHRIHALLTGIGDAPERPGRHAVGVPGTTAVAWLDAGAYELWQWGPVAPTLWALAEARAAAGPSPREAADEVDELLGDLRVLLATSCAYVDLSAEAAADPAQ